MGSLHTPRLPFLFSQKKEAKRKKQKKVWRSRNLSSKGSEAPQARIPVPGWACPFFRPPTSPSGTRPESAANADEVALRKVCNRTFRGRNLAYSYPIIFLDSFIGCGILLSCKRNTKSHRHRFFSVICGFCFLSFCYRLVPGYAEPSLRSDAQRLNGPVLSIRKD